MSKLNYQDLKIDDKIATAIEVLENISRAPTITGKNTEVVADILKQYFGDFERKSAF